MSKFDRLLTLVHPLAEGGDWLMFDDMAIRGGVNRRTAGRMRDVVVRYFNLEVRTDNKRHKRLLIPARLCSTYTRLAVAKAPEAPRGFMRKRLEAEAVEP